MNFWQRIPRKILIIIVVTLGLVVIGKVLAIASWGDTGWEPDSYMHFLELRTIFSDFPNNLSMGLGVWTKPLYAYPFAFLTTVFDWQSLMPLQILNVIVVAITSLFVFDSVKRLTKSNALAYLGLILTNITYLSFRSSLTMLTEPMFMLVLAISFNLLQRKRYGWSSLLIGLSVLGRIEGLWFVALWGLYLLLIKDNWKDLTKQWIVMILPTFVWNLLGFLVTGRVLFILDQGYPTTAGKYGYGGIMHYLEGFIDIDPLLLILFALGALSAWRYLLSKDWLKLLPFAATSSFILLQVIFWKFGLFGTAGLMRYFAGIVPLMIIASLLFWHDYAAQLFTKKSTSVLFVLIIIGLQLAISVRLLAKGDLAGGQRLNPRYENTLAQAGHWIADNAEAQEFVYADRPEVLYYAGRDLRTSANRVDPLWKDTPGVYVWSNEWGEGLGVTLADLESRGKLLVSFAGEVYIYLVD